MSKGKRGVITQKGMYVKIDNNTYDKLQLVPSWNMNKNLTINLALRIGVNIILKSIENKQLNLPL